MIRNWLLYLFNKNDKNGPIGIGMRIKTKRGMGKIVGGNIIVLLDDIQDSRHPNQRRWTFNIDGEI